MRTLLGLALVAAWSSGFIGAELGTRSAPAGTLLAWRYVVATAAFALLLLVLRRRLRRRNLARQGVIGVLCQGVYLGGIVGGVGLGVPPGTAALIAASQPLVVAVLEHVLLGRSTRTRQRVGLALGVAGVALVVSSDIGRGAASPWAYLLPLAGMLGLSLGTVLDRRWDLDDGVLTALTVQTAVVAVLMVAGAATTGPWNHRPRRHSGPLSRGSSSSPRSADTGSTSGCCADPEPPSSAPGSTSPRPPRCSGPRWPSATDRARSPSAVRPSALSRSTWPWVHPPIARRQRMGIQPDARPPPRVPSVAPPSTAPGGTMDHVETVIIGAGQAGLSTAYHLKQQGRDCVVLDRNQRIGDGWRQQWDSLRLYSPAKYDGLPGHAVPGRAVVVPRARTTSPTTSRRTPHRFEHPGPARRPRVPGLLAGNPGAGEGFVVDTDTGPIRCDNVVVATGTFGRTPSVPDFAKDLDPSILQLHSSEYRRPGQLRDGPVLVVGASHSGIRHRLRGRPATRPTTLVGRDCGEIPVRLESRRMKVVFPVLLFLWRHLVTRRTPIGRKEMRARPLPRRADAAGQALRPRRARRRPQRGSRRRRARRAAAARRRHRRRRRQRRLGDRLPAGLRLDQPAGLRRGRLAARVPRRRSTTHPACSSAACPSSTPSPPCWSAAPAATRSTSPARSPQRARDHGRTDASARRPERPQRRASIVRRVLRGRARASIVRAGGEAAMGVLDDLERRRRPAARPPSRRTCSGRRDEAVDLYQRGVPAVRGRRRPRGRASPARSTWR